MKLPKMKNTIIAFGLLFSLQMFAQIPDSLDVDLPWDVVRISSCETTMGEGPSSKKDGVFIYLDKDEKQHDASEQCIVRTKEWQIVDWLGGLVYSYVQVGSVSDLANTNCENELYFHYEDFPLELTPDDLLMDLNPAHVYSFSFDNPDDKNYTIDIFNEGDVDLYVYDHTDNTVCRSNVFITSCEEDIELIFPETAEVEFNAEPYIELTLDMLGVVIDYPCASYETKIRVGNQSNGFLASQYVGGVALVTVEVDVDNGLKYKKQINVIVTGTKPPAKVMYIEDKDFLAGETVVLDVWSEGIAGIIAWQLQIEFENVEVLAIQPSETFDEIPSNIIEDGEVMRALWIPLNGLAFDVASDATWFTLIIKSDIDGNTLDIFREEQDDWSLIAVEDENYLHEFEAEFVFNVAPRNILGTDHELNFSSISVYPNPVLDEMVINGLPISYEPTKIDIYDLAGRLIFQNTIDNHAENLTIDISELPTGMFILKVQNGKFITSHKILKN